MAQLLSTSQPSTRCQCQSNISSNRLPMSLPMRLMKRWIQNLHPSKNHPLHLCKMSCRFSHLPTSTDESSSWHLLYLLHAQATSRTTAMSSMPLAHPPPAVLWARPPLYGLECWENLWETSPVFSADLQSISADRIYCWEKFRIYMDPYAHEGTVPSQHYCFDSLVAWRPSLTVCHPSHGMDWCPSRGESYLLCSVGKADKAHVMLSETATRCCIKCEEASHSQGVWADPGSLLQDSQYGTWTVWLSYQFSLTSYDWGAWWLCKTQGRRSQVICIIPWVWDLCPPPMVTECCGEKRCSLSSSIGIMDTKYDCLPTLHCGLKITMSWIKRQMSLLLLLLGWKTPFESRKLCHQQADVLKCKDFMMDREGRLGTHRVRKMAVTFARCKAAQRWGKSICFLHSRHNLTHLLVPKMAHTITIAGKTLSPNMRHMLVKIFDFWMPNLWQHCAKAV